MNHDDFFRLTREALSSDGRPFWDIETTGSSSSSSSAAEELREDSREDSGSIVITQTNNGTGGRPSISNIRTNVGGISVSQNISLGSPQGVVSTMSSDQYQILYKDRKLVVTFKKAHPVPLNIQVQGQYMIEDDRAPKMNLQPMKPQDDVQEHNGTQALLQKDGFRLFLNTNNVILDTQGSTSLRSLTVQRQGEILCQCDF